MSRRTSRRSSTWNRTRKLSVSLIGALLLRDGWSCAYCGVEVEGLAWEIDHVIPLSRLPVERGGSRPENLVIACEGCNRNKGNGPVPYRARGEVRRRTSRPVDYAAGRELGERLYPWETGKREKKNQRRRDERARKAIERVGDFF